MDIEFEILREEEFVPDSSLEERYLQDLDCYSDNADKWALWSWRYEFDVLVTNQKEESRQFKVIFQSVESNQKADVWFESAGVVRDESYELISFCEEDMSIIYELRGIALDEARAEYERLLLWLEENGCTLQC